MSVSRDAVSVMWSHGVGHGVGLHYYSGLRPVRQEYESGVKLLEKGA